MKTQQKKRRSLALIAALILCITTILPFTVSADTLPTRPSSALYSFETTADFVSPQYGEAFAFCYLSMAVFYHNETGAMVERYGDDSTLLVLDDTGDDGLPYWRIWNEYYLSDDETHGLNNFPAREWSVYVYPYASYLPYDFQYELGSFSNWGDFEYAMNDYGEWNGTTFDFVPSDLNAYVKGWKGAAYRGAVNDRYDEGYNAGRESGLAAGKELGYAEGVATAQDEAYADGFAAGETAALNAEGTLMDLVFGIFAAPIDLINNTLNFDLFGINLAGLVRTIITLAAAAIFITAIVKVGAGKG